MNRKARELGMKDTHYVEPTGLSSRNQSTARDLALLVHEAYQHPLLRQYTTSPEAAVPVGESHGDGGSGGRRTVEQGQSASLGGFDVGGGSVLVQDPCCVDIRIGVGADVTAT